MKKTDYTRLLRLQQSRWRKKLKRKRKNKIYTGKYSNYLKYQTFKKRIDDHILSQFKSNLYDFLRKEGFVDMAGVGKTKFKIVNIFSLSENYDETINQIQQITAALYTSSAEVVLDFSKCKEVDPAALIILKIIYLELATDFKELDSKLTFYSAQIKLRVIHSSNKDVNLYLFLFQLASSLDIDREGFIPINSIGYLKGSKSQKDYLENKKATIASAIVKYVNKCLLMHKVELAPTGINYIEGLITEILGNAEDHSPMNTYYASANFSEIHIQGDDNQHVGQLNISFLNFGYSIYDGFENTKIENVQTYQEMENLFNKVSPKLDSNFTRESMFTLYALQEGFSSLKFEDESRGTGTMKFINSFFAIGDYEDSERGFKPSLNIFSGSTFIRCDNRYKPFKKEERYFISLNDSQSLYDIPSKKHLKVLKQKFPGTVLGVNIYLNAAHLRKKIDSNGTKD